MSVKASIRENSVSTNSADLGNQGSWADVSNAWTVRPSDSQPFTKTDIDNLQIGESIRGSSFTATEVSQVYVVVDYTPPPPFTPYTNPMQQLLAQ